MPDRTVQLASVIRAAVQAVIARGLNDPRVRGLISVTKVEVAPDMSEARIFVSILPAEDANLTMHGLHSAARHIQSQIAREIVSRRLPRLTFKLDDSLKRQALIDAAITHTHPAGDHPGDDSKAPSHDPSGTFENSGSMDWKESST